MEQPKTDESKPEGPPNVFLGKINLPPEPAEEEEEMKGEPEPSDSYMLHDEDGEEFRLPKPAYPEGDGSSGRSPEKENEVGDQAPWEEEPAKHTARPETSSLYIEPEEPRMRSRRQE